METTIRQLHIHAETRGTASDLPLVVFLHGWGCEGKIFGALLDTAGEKYPVLAPDLRQLSELFVQCHLRQQFFDPLFSFSIHIFRHLRTYYFPYPFYDFIL